MSAAYLPPDPSGDLLPEPFPAFGSNPNTTTVPVRSPDRPIRFPHIPSIDQTPPGMAQYLQRQQQALRIDQAHAMATTGAPPRSGRVEAMRPTSVQASPAPKLESAPAQAEEHRAGEHRSELPLPTRVRPAEAPARDGLRSLSTQVEQIAEYLRRRRNELETEQTDLKLNALMQEAALLQEREQLRGQQLNIQMVQATLEILRRQLLEFGNALSDVVPAGDTLQSQFEAVCQAYYDVGSVARLLDADQ
jgi:hypothetical protein